MSMAWQKDLVLWREPWRAAATRLTRRALVPAAAVVTAGVPGLWEGTLRPMWLRVVIWVIGAFALFLWALALANILRGRRVLLVLRPTGAIERPLSIQEGWLKRPQEYAIGAAVTVTDVGAGLMPSPSDPRVTLAAEGSIARVPLHGTSVEQFMATVNQTLAGRGVALVEPKGKSAKRGPKAV